MYFTDGSVLALQNQYYYIMLYSRLTMYCLRIYGSLVSIIAHLLWSERERKPHFIWWWCAEYNREVAVFIGTPHHTIYFCVKSLQLKSQKRVKNHRVVCNGMLWGDWSTRFSGRSEKRVKPQGGKNSQYYYDSDYTCWQLNENAQHCTEGHCKKSRAAAAAAAVFRFFMVAADLARLVCKFSKKGTHKIIERLRGVRMLSATECYEEFEVLG